MEQKDVQNVEETKETKTTENVDTQSTEEKEEKEEKTFTQDEVNTMIQDRLAKEKKKLPTKEELEAYENWKESQKTETEKQQEKEKEYNDTKSENTTLKQEIKVLRSGVNEEDVDYVMFKVSKMEGDFEDNLEEFLKDNPKYLQKQETTTSKDTGVAVSRIKENAESGVDAILRAKHPELFNEKE